MFSGHTLRGAGERRALVRFDVGAAVPAGSTITAAELGLHCSRTNAAPCPVELRRVLRPWGEGASSAFPPGGQGTDSTPGDATWVHAFYPDQFWTAPGGEFGPVPSAALVVADVGFVTWSSTPALVADVQGWLDNPADNHGWLLLTPPVGENSARRYDTRENPDASLRPRLTITYLPPLPCPCEPDFNCSGAATVQDIYDFLNDWNSQSAGGPIVLGIADYNGADGVTVQDIYDFLGAWNLGCP